MGTPRPLTKKQVVDMVSRGDSLAGLDLRGTDLSNVCFDGIDLAEAKLADCNLVRCTFRGSDLRAASLWHADCTDAVFDQANLEEADFDLAFLDGCSFRGAKIRKAIFPLSRLSLETLKTSVKTGKRIRMERRPSDD